MRKISLIKTSKLLMLLLFIASVFVGCESDDDDSDELGNWFKSSTFDGDSRSGAVTFTIGDKGYLVTGYDGDDFLEDFWVYDAESDFWSDANLAPFPGVARSGAVAFAIGTKGYVGTGYDGDNELNDFWEYDSVANSWRELTGDAVFPGSARFGAIGFSVGGFGYVGTGDDGSEQKDFYKYDPVNDTWTQEVGFGGEKRQEATVFIIDDVAYIGGGVQNGSIQTDFYSFNGTTWTSLTDLDDDDEDNEVYVTSGVAFSIDGKGYVGAGLLSSVSTSVWEYTPEDDSWDEVPDFEGSARQEASAFTFEDLNTAYVLMGRSGSSYYDDVWEFQPDVLENEDD